MRFKKEKVLTVAAIILFVLVFLWGRNAESAEVGVGLGFGLFNSIGATTQEISVASDDYRWFVSYTRVGGADSDRLILNQNNRYTAAYRVFFRRSYDWKPYLSLGIAYFDEVPQNLISEHLTYDMRLGVRWKNILELDIDAHNSTAGRAERNTGFDTANLRVVFQF